jgi:hypothetical protein
LNNQTAQTPAYMSDMPSATELAVIRGEFLTGGSKYIHGSGFGGIDTREAFFSAALIAPDISFACHDKIKQRDTETCAALLTHFFQTYWIVDSSTTLPPCSTTSVTVEKSTSVTVAVQLLFGQPQDFADWQVGSSVLTQNVTLPFLIWLDGIVVTPLTTTLPGFPGATLPAGLTQLVLRVPSPMIVMVRSPFPNPVRVAQTEAVVPLSL